MKNFILIFIIILPMTNIGLAQKPNEEVENLYQLGVESRDNAGFLDFFAKSKAIEYFTEALKIEPRNIKILLERAQTYKIQRNYDKALADCEQALEFVLQNAQPKQLDLYKIFKTKGEISDHREDYKLALISYELALKYKPEDSPTTMAVRRIYRLLSDDISDNEIEKTVNSTMVNLRLPAPNNPKSKVKKQPPPDNFYRLGLANLKNAEAAKTNERWKYFFDLAFENFNKSIKVNPNFARAYFERSKMYEKRAKWRLIDLNQAIELEPNYADAYLERAKVWELDEPENRLYDLTKAIQLKPPDAETLLQRGEVYVELCEFEKALADREKARQIVKSAKVKSQTGLVDVYLLDGSIYEKGFYYDKAIEALTKALELAPEDAGFYRWRGDIYRYIGETRKAEVDFAKADSIKKYIPPGVGHGTGSGGGYYEPPEEYQFFAFPRFRIETIVVRANFHQTIKADRQRNLNNAKKIVKFNSQSELAHWQLAQAYLGDGKLDQAIAEFTTLVEMNKRYEYLNNLGVILTRKENFQDSIVQFELAIKADGTRYEASYNRGFSYLKLKENEKAIADFTEVIKLKPKFTIAYISRAKSFRAIGKTVEAEADRKMVDELIGRSAKPEVKEKAPDDPVKPTPPKSTSSPLRILAKPRVNYTEIARKNQVQGIVTLRVEFRANGSIGNISVVKGLPDGLNERAIEAARGIRFTPATKDGVPITVIRQIEYSFTLY